MEFTPENKRKFDELLLRKDFFDLPAKWLVHAVIVIRVDKSTVLQIRPQPLNFLIVKRHIPVSREEENRIVEKFTAIKNSRQTWHFNKLISQYLLPQLLHG